MGFDLSSGVLLHSKSLRAPPIRKGPKEDDKAFRFGRADMRENPTEVLNEQGDYINDGKEEGGKANESFRGQRGVQRSRPRSEEAAFPVPQLYEATKVHSTKERAT